MVNRIIISNSDFNTDSYASNVIFLNQTIPQVAKTLQSISQISSLKVNDKYNKESGNLKGILFRIIAYLSNILLVEISVIKDRMTTIKQDFDKPYDLVQNIINSGEEISDEDYNEVVEWISAGEIFVKDIVATLDNICKAMESYDWNAIPVSVDKIIQIINDQEGVDDYQVQQIQGSINALKSQISELTAEIVILSAAVTGEVALGVTSLATFGPIGGIVSLFLMPVLLTEVAILTLDDSKLTILKSDVENKSKQLSAVQQDAVQLVNASSDMLGMKQTTSKVVVDFMNIRDAWSELHRQFLQLTDDIKSVENSDDRYNLIQRVDDVNNVIKNIIDEEEKMQIPSTYFSMGYYSVGDSANDIKSKYQSYEKMDIFDYMKMLLSD
ncbi:hypothetical protein ACLBWS_10920 [Brucellaceae bacterium D45D]